MNLKDALEQSKVGQVLRRLDGVFGIEWRPAATRPYFNGQYPYTQHIIAFSAAEFYVAENLSKGADEAVPLNVFDTWQIIGKDDWEPR